MRLEGAIPDRVSVERRRDSLFSKHSHVTHISISAESNVYALVLEHGHLQAKRSKSVHGVTLKSEILSVPDWLKSLQGDLAVMADHAGSAQQVLHDFLMS